MTEISFLCKSFLELHSWVVECLMRNRQSLLWKKMWLSYFQSEKSWLGPSSIRMGTLKHSNWECFVNAKLAWNGPWWIRVTCLYTHPAVTEYSSLGHWAVLQPGLSHFTLPSVSTRGTSEPCGGAGRPCLILTQSFLSNRVRVWSSPMNSHPKQTLYWEHDKQPANYLNTSKSMCVISANINIKLWHVSHPVPCVLHT